jgi:hypothetical protein
MDTDLSSRKGLPTKWQMKDGSRVDIKDMDEKHLVNIIDMFRGKKTVARLVDDGIHKPSVVFDYDEDMIGAMEIELMNRGFNSK